MRGYKKLANSLLAHAVKNANLIESDSPKIVVEAIMDIEFLGGCTAEMYFDLSGFDQQWALEKIDYSAKLTRALERMQEDDIHVALTQKCKDIIRSQLQISAVRGGRPRAIVADFGHQRLEQLRRNLECGINSSGWPYSS